MTSSNFRPTPPRLRDLCVGVSTALLMFTTFLPQTALANADEAKPSPAGAAPSAEDFGRLPALSGLTLSPDGKHLAALTSPDGKIAQISVWDTSDFSKPPTIIGSDKRVRFMDVTFVKNDRMMVTFRQLLDYGEMRDFLFQARFTDLTGAKWFSGTPEKAAKTDDDELNRLLGSADIVSYLPNDPENVLVAGDDGAIYKSNLKTGKIGLLERLGDKDGDLLYDVNGQLRAKSRIEYENGKIYIQQLLKNPDTGVWEEHFRAYAKDREIPSIVALTKDPNIILVSARRGKDHTAIYNYDIRAKAFKDVAFEHPLFDADDVITDHRTKEIVAFSYMADRPTEYYADDKLAATMDSISAALGVKSEKVDWTDLANGKKVKVEVPNGDNVELVDYSSDFTRLIVLKSGPSNPGDYYLYQDGKGLFPLGQVNPSIDRTKLGEGHMVQYVARDGRPIPAFVYKPNPEAFGKGPYPTLIIPHGGPWARDYLEWDVITPWAQYFVSRGYAVAEPQYRGSDGWGMAQWTAGDNKWGQEMSDDMDDVALGMVKEGLADPKRLAMHGYSFGGYSTMAAIVRPNPIYQCAISGAGPSSPKSMQDRTKDSRFGREFQRPFVGGLNALQNVQKASIPILIYHGDRDRNVMPRESKEFYDALVAAHKTAKYEAFKDMGHEAGKWTPEHAAYLLTMVDAFLQSGCRADGKPF